MQTFLSYNQFKLASRLEGEDLGSEGGSSTTVTGSQRWVPPTANERINPTEIVFRKIRGILNKLTPETFPRLSHQLIHEVGITSLQTLRGAVILVFDKAVDEPHYCSLYAKLCWELDRSVPNFEPPLSHTTTFRKLLLRRCEEEFAKRHQHLLAAGGEDNGSPGSDPAGRGEEGQSYATAKRRVLGNVAFIGELFRLGLLHESTMHSCVKQLLDKKKGNRLAELQQNIECLCQLLLPVGCKLDTPDAKGWMDKYFERMQGMSELPDLELRYRFMLQNVIELRRRKWKYRSSHQKDSGPKTIQEIRREAYVSSSQLEQTGSQGQQGGVLPWQQQFPGGTAMWQHGSGTGREQAISDEGFVAPPPSSLHGHKSQLPPSPMLEEEDLVPRRVVVGTKAPTAPVGGGSGSPGRGRESSNKSSQTGVAGDKKQVRKEGVSLRPSSKKFSASGRQPLKNKDDSTSKPEELQTQTEPTPVHDIDEEDERRRHHLTMAANQIPPPGGPPFFGSRPPRPPHFIGRHHRLPPPGPHPFYGRPQLEGPPHHEMPLSYFNGPHPLPNMEAGMQFARPQRPPNMPPGYHVQPLPPPNMGICYPPPYPPDVRSPRPWLPGDPEWERGREMAGGGAPRERVGGPSPLEMHQPLPIKVSTGKGGRKPSAGQHKKKVTGGVQSEEEQLLLGVLSHLLASRDVQGAVMGVREHSSLGAERVCKFVVSRSLGLSEEDRIRVSHFVHQLIKEGVVKREHFMQSFSAILDSVHDDLHQSKVYLAGFMARAVAEEHLTLRDVLGLFSQGRHHPTALFVLRSLVPLLGEERVGAVFRDTGVKLTQLVPAGHRSTHSLIKLLEERKLEFLYPLKLIQKELSSLLQANTNTVGVYKWIKTNVDSSLYSDPEFVAMLTTCILEHVTSESTLSSGSDSLAPSQATKEKEKGLFEDRKVLIERFVGDSLELQMTVLYATQVFCYNHSFPKGLLLRLFHLLYNCDVVEEEVYHSWKEDIAQDFPGKEKALFQVNQWLNLLAEASEEESEEN